MDDPVLLRAKFLLSAFAEDDEKPSNKNEVKEVSQDLLCGAIKGSSLISTYSDARSIAKRGQFIYIDSNKCQVAEDAEWTSSKIQLANDYDGDTNFNAIITLAPNPNKIKKNKNDKKKKFKPALSPSSPSTISIQQSIASSDQPYLEILEKANSLLSDIKSANVNIENSPTIATKPSKSQIKKHVSNLLNNSSNSNTIYENDEDNNDEDDDDSHNVSVKSIHNKNSKSCLNPVNKHTSSSSSPNNINNNSFINKAITASHIPQSNEYHDESSSSYDKLYQNNSQTYTTGTSYTSLKADADKATADMKRQVILSRLAQKMKEDKEKLIEKEIEEEKKKSELKWKSDQKAKQFQEITSERVAKRLKEEALRREELEKQKQLEDELKLKKAQEAIEGNQTKLKELKKETAKRLRQRELEKKKEMEDEIKNIALKIEEMALQTGRSKVLLRPDNSSTTSFRNHNNNSDSKYAASHTKSIERHTKHQTIGRHRHNPSHTKTNSSKDDYDKSNDSDGDEEDDNDLLSQDSLHQKLQKKEFYEENNEETDYADDEAEDGAELNEQYLKLMQSSSNIKQFSNSNLNHDLMNKAKSSSVNKSDNNNNKNSSKSSVKNSSNKIDSQNNSKPNELQSISKIPRAQINKSSYMNIDNDIDIHNSFSQNNINRSPTITPLQRAHTSSSVIIDNYTETNYTNNIRQSSSASKFVDRTRQTINHAKKLIPISNNNSSKNPATTTIKPTKSKETKGKATNSASNDIQHKDEIGIITKVRKMSDHSVFSEITTMEDEDNDNGGLDEVDDKEDKEYLLTNGLEKEKNILNNQALGYEDYAVTAINVACKPKMKKQFQPWRKLKPISIPAYRPLPPPPSLTVHD